LKKKPKVKRRRRRSVGRTLYQPASSRKKWKGVRRQLWGDANKVQMGCHKKRGRHSGIQWNKTEKGRRCGDSVSEISPNVGNGKGGKKRLKKMRKEGLNSKISRKNKEKRNRRILSSQTILS